MFGDLYWLLCNVAHTVFATKLWSLSLKLLAAVKIGSADSSQRVVACFFAQCVAIVICYCLLMWLGWDVLKRDKYSRYVELLSSIPAFVETIIIMLGFINLAQTGQHSRFQISQK